MNSIRTQEKLSGWDQLISNEIRTGKLVGVSLVYFDGEVSSAVFRGYTSLKKENLIGNKTKFEIASLTKIFTGLVCAKLILQRKISLDTEIGEFNWKSASEDVKRITLKELITHNSGLPRLPININPSNPLNPYYDYTEAMLIDGLSDIKIDSKEYRYSNLGYAVLGKILSVAGGINFEEQLNTVLLELKLGNTEIFNGDELKNLSDAHNERLERVPHWSSKIFKIFWRNHFYGRGFIEILSSAFNP